MMKDYNLPPSVFAGTTYGESIALSLIRTLALQESELGAEVLDAALKHPLIEHGFRLLDQEKLLQHAEGGFLGADSTLEYRQTKLVLRVLDQLKIAKGPRFTELIVRRAYNAGDTELAAKEAKEALRTARNDYALIAHCHDVLGKCYADEGHFKQGAFHFSAGAEAARSGKLSLEEWELLTGLIWCLQSLGDHFRALREIDLAEQLARKNQQPDAVTKSLLDRGNTLLQLSELEKAARAFEAALLAAREAENLPRASDALGNLGIIAFQKGEYVVAENYHRQALELSRTFEDQESAQFDLNNLGLALQSQGRLEEALTAHTEALQIAQMRNAQVYAQRYSQVVETLRQRIGRAAKEADLGRRNQPFGTGTKTQLPNPEIEKKVRALLNAQDLPSAIRLLDQHIHDSPEDWQARTLYGLVLMIGGDNEGARTQIEKAIEMNPDGLDPNYRLVDLYTRLGQLDDLRLRYERLVSEQPFRAGLQMGLALIDSRLNRLDDALRHAVEAERLSGNDLATRVLAEVQFNQALMLLPVDWDRALATFQDCTATLFRLTGSESEQMGQWLTYTAQSFETFAIQAHAAAPPLEGGMGSFEIALLARAAVFYREAAERDPLRSHEEAIERVFYLIMSAARAEQMTTAAEHLRTERATDEATLLLQLSVEADPEHAETYHQLAWLILQKGEPDSRKDALTVLQMAIQLDPANPTYRGTQKFFENAKTFDEV